MKRNPEHVLNSLTANSHRSDYRFERLYRNLFNEQMYVLACQNIGARLSGSRPAAGLRAAGIDLLIAALRKESYRPLPLRAAPAAERSAINPACEIPEAGHTLLQEVIRMILEAIYEQSFEQASHAYRPNRSCHTALMQLSQSFGGAKWFIQGEIDWHFDHINHARLISILEERIADNRFIRLIRKFLNAGYFQQWAFDKTYSGSPLGGLLSPILSNIYLDKLDQYVKAYLRGADHRMLCPSGLVCSQSARDTDGAVPVLQAGKAVSQANMAENRAGAIPSQSPTGGYVRYANAFILGVRGSVQDCKQTGQDITLFLHDQLKLALSAQKPLITPAQKAARFLSFALTAGRTCPSKRNAEGNTRRADPAKIVIKIPHDAIRNKLLDYQVLVIKVDRGTALWKPKHRKGLIFQDDLEILRRYNTEIRSFYHYYSVALNSATIHNFGYIMEYSMYKTFAAKYRSSVSSICKKYKKSGVFTVFYTNRTHEGGWITFYNDGFKRNADVQRGEPLLDMLPYCTQATLRSRLPCRLLPINTRSAGRGEPKKRPVKKTRGHGKAKARHRIA